MTAPEKSDFERHLQTILATLGIALLSGTGVLLVDMRDRFIKLEIRFEEAQKLTERRLTALEDAHRNQLPHNGTPGLR